MDSTWKSKHIKKGNFEANYTSPLSSVRPRIIPQLLHSKQAKYLAIMKVSSVLFSITAFVLSALAQSTQTLSYDPTYDNGAESFSNVACSDGVNGLETKGYTTFNSLPTFPNVGGVYTVTGYNSTACGTCYQVTYGSSTVAILAIDRSNVGFTVSETAMNTLTGNQAVALGRVDVTATQVDASVCGL